MVIILAKITLVLPVNCLNDAVNKQEETMYFYLYHLINLAVIVFGFLILFLYTVGSS